MYRSLSSVSWSTSNLLKAWTFGWTKARMGSCQKDAEMVAPKEEVIRFTSDSLCKVGVSCEDAHIVAHHLMTADYRGHFSHGMNRMPMYVQDIKDGMSDPCAKPQIVTDYQVIVSGDRYILGIPITRVFKLSATRVAVDMSMFSSCVQL